MKLILTCTGTSHKIPSGSRTDRSARTRVICICSQFAKSRRIATDRGIKSKLEPRSHKHCGKLSLRIPQLRTKLPGSESFGGILFLIMLLTCEEIVITPCLVFKSLVPILFAYCLIIGENIRSYISGISIINLSIIALHLASSSSLLDFLGLLGKGTLGFIAFFCS